VITDVDEALCVLLGRSLPEGTMVRLDPPKPTWETERPSNAIDLFLFALREDREGRETGFADERDERGAVRSRRAPARRCALSYLVTARAQKVNEEHLLLGIALRTMLFTESLPADCMPSALAAVGVPVLIRISDADPGALWSNLGMPARAAFAITVSAPFQPEPDTDIAPPAEKLRLDAGQKKPSGPLSPAEPRRWVRTP
jgi:hypothetical protein